MARLETYSIGGLSRQTGCNVETIRYYERVGILPSPPRTEGGHRIYSKSHLKRLGFVRRCRELGFTLEEVRGLLSLVDGGEYTCAEVLQLTRAHLSRIQDKIRDLRRLEGTLSEIVSNCDGGEVPECPIVDALYQ